MWEIVFTKHAVADSEKISAAGLKEKVIELIEILRNNPYQTTPKFKILKGDLSGAISRRINLKHRLVYQIIDEQKTVKIIRMWSHYE